MINYFLNTLITHNHVLINLPKKKHIDRKSIEMFNGGLGENQTSMRYVIFALLTVLTFVLVLAWVVVLYYWTPQQQQQEGPLFWVLFVLNVMRITFLTCVIARCAAPRVRWFKFLLALICIAFVLSEIAGIVIFVDERKTCNNAPTASPSGINNACNDFRWCCVYESTNNYAAAQCLVNGVSCDDPMLSADDLSANWVFDYSFASTVIFMIFGIVHLIVGLWVGDGTEYSTYTEDYNSVEMDSFDSINSSINQDSSASVTLNKNKWTKKVVSSKKK